MHLSYGTKNGGRMQTVTMAEFEQLKGALKQTHTQVMDTFLRGHIERQQMLKVHEEVLSLRDQVEHNMHRYDVMAKELHTAIKNSIMSTNLSANVEKRFAALEKYFNTKSANSEVVPTALANFSESLTILDRRICQVYMWLLAFMSISIAALGFSFWNWLNK